MPVTLSGVRQSIVPIAVLGALALAVLYVIFLGPVHAPRPPEPLSRLELAKTLKTVPDAAFTDAAGTRHTLSEFRGRTVLLNLWAPWCGPCVRELPALAKLSRAMRRSEFIVAPVDIGRDSPDEARRFLRAHAAAALPVYLDTDRVFMGKFRAYGLPLSVLIDPKGREIGRAFGASQWDAPDAVAYLKRAASSQ